MYNPLEDSSTGSEQAGSVLSKFQAVIEDEDERYKKIVWFDSMSGNKLEHQIVWDGKFADGAQADSGEYFITLKISDTPVEYRMPPPLMGEHTEQVLKELGYEGEAGNK